MSYINDTKPNTSYSNDNKPSASSYTQDTKPNVFRIITWANILTTWATETYTWAGIANASIYTNDNK
jgi:hypothetical protein